MIKIKHKKMTFLSVNPIQRGYGLGGFLKGLSWIFKPLIKLFSGGGGGKVVNVLRKVASHPIAKKTLARSKKQLSKNALNVLSDISQGKNVSKSLKNRSKEAIKNVGKQSLKDIIPEVVKTVKKKTSLKRKRSIFD